MQITAITRYKHGKIYGLLQKLGWTQADLVRRSGLSLHVVGRIINLQGRPSREAADAIQRAFGEAGEYLDVLEEWPETFLGLKRGFKRTQTEDIPLESLLESGAMGALDLGRNPREDLELQELEARVSDVFETLTEREKAVLTSRFLERKTLFEAGEDVRSAIGVRKKIQKHSTAAYAQAAENHALRKMRHPCRIRQLEEFV